MHFVQKWVIVVIEGSEAHEFEDGGEKEERVEVLVEYYARETPICTDT